jgi:two-component system chemotaxis response regulator CheY
MAKRVLITDDSTTAFHQLKKVVEGTPGEFEVVGHATTGEESVSKFRELRPDLVTMDLVMPGIDGVETIRQILAEDPKASIVVVSSMGGIRDKVVAALTAGAKNLIAKPFEPDQVLAVLRAL